ncbi:MAG: hypothetical protein ACLQU2_00835 [Candidatus Binataceae bacterium]
MIEQVRGLSMDPPSETFDAIGGLDSIKSFFTHLLDRISIRDKHVSLDGCFFQPELYVITGRAAVREGCGVKKLEERWLPN